MRRGIRNVLSIGALTAGLALAGTSAAQAQVRFEGSLPIPNGRISIGIGDAGFRAGAVAPFGYEIYSHPDYGYGFAYRSRWIPVERRGRQWIVIQRPLRFARTNRDDWRFARPFERWEDLRIVGRAQEQRYGRSDDRDGRGRDDGRGRNDRNDNRRGQRQDRFHR